MSTKTISGKLQIKENYSILVINEQAGYRSQLGKLPANVTIATTSTEPVDLIQVFTVSKKDLKDQLTRLKPILKPKGLLWITYPKGTSKVATDLNRDIIREFAATLDLQAVAIVSIDDKWAALRLKKV